MVSHEYQEQIRKCNVEVREGAGSDNYADICYVDWRPVLHPDDPDFPLAGCEFELGFDPTLDPPAWVDSDLRFAPAPVWADSEEYIKELEKTVIKLRPDAEPKTTKPK